MESSDPSAQPKSTVTLMLSQTLHQQFPAKNIGLHMHNIIVNIIIATSIAAQHTGLTASITSTC